MPVSKTSKMPCLSWSLQAGETCPGSYDKNGAVVPACAVCYAKGGNYHFPNVKAARAENKKEWRQAHWVSDMIKALEKEKHFRWFDSGDMYHPALAHKIAAICEQTPHVRHWIPTKSYKIAKFAPALRRLNALPNVSVRYSSDAIDGSYTKKLHRSTIIPVGSPAPLGATLCQAPAQGGQCLACRACWDKTGPVVAYQAHGQAAARLIQLSRKA